MHPPDRLPERFWRPLAALVSLAYTRALERELADLERDLRAWRSGSLSPHDVEGRIHAFHQGRARELWALYSWVRRSSVRQQVAAALVRGDLQPDDLPPDARPMFEGALRSRG